MGDRGRAGEEQPIASPLVLESYIVRARLVELGAVGRAERLDGESHSPRDQELELTLRRMTAAQCAARELRRNDQPGEVERIQPVPAVLGGRRRAQPERLARRDDLIPRPGEAGHRAARPPHRLARRCHDVAPLQSLHQDHPVPAVSCDARDPPALERGYVRGLHRLTPVGEAGRARVGPEKHGRVGVAREERVEIGLVAAAEQAELGHHSVGRGGGALQPQNLE